MFYDLDNFRHKLNNLDLVINLWDGNKSISPKITNPPFNFLQTIIDYYKRSGDKLKQIKLSKIIITQHIVTRTKFMAEYECGHRSIPKQTGRDCAKLCSPVKQFLSDQNISTKPFEKYHVKRGKLVKI